MNDRSSSESGCVSIAVDFRSPEGGQKIVDADRVAVLMQVLTELGGPGTDVVFDFGVFTIRNVNLDAVLERFTLDAATDDAAR